MHGNVGVKRKRGAFELQQSAVKKSAVVKLALRRLAASAMRRRVRLAMKMLVASAMAASAVPPVEPLSLELPRSPRPQGDDERAFGINSSAVAIGFELGGCDKSSTKDVSVVSGDYGYVSPSSTDSSGVALGATSESGSPDGSSLFPDQHSFLGSFVLYSSSVKACAFFDGAVDFSGSSSPTLDDALKILVGPYF